jgi:hypothetical protein
VKVIYGKWEMTQNLCGATGRATKHWSCWLTGGSCEEQFPCFVLLCFVLFFLSNESVLVDALL